MKECNYNTNEPFSIEWNEIDGTQFRRVFLCFNPSFRIELANVSPFCWFHYDPINKGYPLKVLYLQSPMIFFVVVVLNAKFIHLHVLNVKRTATKKRMIANFRGERKKHTLIGMICRVYARAHIKWVWLRFIHSFRAEQEEDEDDCIKFKQQNYCTQSLHCCTCQMLRGFDFNGFAFVCVCVRVSVEHYNMPHGFEMQQTSQRTVPFVDQRRRGRKRCSLK